MKLSYTVANIGEKFLYFIEVSKRVLHCTSLVLLVVYGFSVFMTDSHGFQHYAVDKV